MRQSRRAPLSTIVAALLVFIGGTCISAAAAAAAAAGPPRPPPSISFSLVVDGGAVRGRPGPPSGGLPSAPGVTYTLLLPSAGTAAPAAKANGTGKSSSDSSAATRRDNPAAKAAPPPPPPPTAPPPSPPPLPLVLLLNGANVESRWYSRLAALLVAAGYPVALSDAYREVPAALRAQASGGDPGGAQEQRRARNGCPSPAFLLAPNAGLLRALLAAADGGETSGGGGGVRGMGAVVAAGNATAAAAAAAAVSAGAGDPVSAAAAAALSALRLRERGVVLLGHSFGGAAAATLIGGRCVPSPALVPGGNAGNGASGGGNSGGPPATNGTLPAAGAAAAARGPVPDFFSLLCGGWQPADRDLALIRGVVLLEGYPSAPSVIDLGSAGRAAAAAAAPASRGDLPGGSSSSSSGGSSTNSSTGSTGRGPGAPFVLYLNGEFNARVRASYDATAEAAKKGAAKVSGGGNGGSKQEGGGGGGAGACVAYARFKGLNHYLGVDWVDPRLAAAEGSQGNGTAAAAATGAQSGGASGNGSAAAANSTGGAGTGAGVSRQVTPCGVPASSDPLGFGVTREIQEAGTARIASLIDAVVRAQAVGDAAAERRLLAAKARAEAGGAKGGGAPGEALELLHAGPGCRFGGGGGGGGGPVPRRA